MVVRRPYEEEPVPRLDDAIGDRERRLAAGRNRRLELQVDAPVVHRKTGRSGNAVDLQVDGVEAQPPDGLVERSHRRRADSLEPLASEVGRKVKIDVLDGDELIGSVARAGPRQRERLMLVRIVGHRVSPSIRAIRASVL